MFISPVSSAVTGPSPLCADEPATVTCNITGGTLLTWTLADGGSRNELARIESSESVMSFNDAFTVSVLTLTPNLVSQVMFTPTNMLNGSTLLCGGLDGSGMIVDETFSIQVLSGKFP